MISLHLSLQLCQKNEQGTCGGSTPFQDSLTARYEITSEMPQAFSVAERKLLCWNC